jgi:hypothetical protein
MTMYPLKGMKRVLVFIVCAGLAAGAAFMLTRWAGAEKSLPLEEQLSWLKTEFRLSEAQVSAIQILHDDYVPVCRTHCEKIQQARKAVDLAAKRVEGGDAEKRAEAVEAARAELRRVEAVCREATRAHLLRVAAVMEPAQAERFIDLVLPKLGGQKHDESCELK